jgi:hypothetical protein
VVPNVPYQLTFWTNFDNAQAGSIGVMLNDQPYYTVGATDRGWGGDAFAINTVNYTPANDTVTIKFEYYFEFVASLDRIDQISFSRVV